MTGACDDAGTGTAALLVRGTTVGLVGGLGAVSAHASAAGHDLATIPALILVLLGALSGPLLVRRANLPGLAGLAVAAIVLQLVAHLVLALTGPTMSLVPLGGHDMAGTAGMAEMSHGGASMLAGHLGVALATALLARRADRALLDLAAVVARGWLGFLLEPPTPGPVRVPVRRATHPGSDVRHPRRAPRTSAAGPRAPPRRSRLQPSPA